MKNRKKLPLLICTLLMIVATLISAFSSVLSAASGADLGSSPYFGLYDGDLSIDRSQYYNGTSIFRLPEKIKDDDEISIIVQMNGTSLLDAYNAAGTDLSFSDYFLTEEASDVKRDIEHAINDYKAMLGEKSVEYKNGVTYSTIFDGFEIIVKAGDFVDVCKILGDDVTVVVGEVYDPAKTELVENDVNAFETGIFDTTGFGYDGTGTIVAVLDTGLDYYHTAFSPSNFAAPEGSWALTFDEVAALIGDTAANTLRPGLTASDVYINGKVPFGFDYADYDSDVFPIQSDHGTHVAGIIAGKDDTITGVAPNAQLAIMKVFSDIEQSARSSWILRALEDCVVLGVDVINMSLGSAAGFSRNSDKEIISGVYDDIREHGISLICAASNSYNSSFASEKNGNLPLTSNPDSATVGSPSTYMSALSVASIEGAKTSYLLFGDRIIYFTESSTRSSEEKHFVEELLGDVMDTIEMEYVTIPGSGIEADYTGLDVTGKIALIRRGTTTFEEKANTAEKMGAAGAIVYNNVSGDIKMNVGETKIPVCSISQDDGEALAATSTGVIKVSYKQAAGPFMSDFSSWGPTPDLRIKPEITAHGGSILSAVPGQDYDRLSGTSMACPNIAGVASLLREYVKTSGVFSEDVTSDPTKVTAAVNRLLMSTADIIYNKNGNPYSIRKQGAGLANLINCKNTTAYILTYDMIDGSLQDKSKIELGDDPDKTGVYTLVFTIDNFGETAVSYDVDAIVMTEGVSDTFTNQGETTVTETATLLEGATVVVSSVDGGAQNGNSVTVEAGKLATVTVTITLGDQDKKYLDESFENGMYVEGFVTLEATGSTSADLNVPYLAFYGDWTEAPLFDIDYFETNKDELDDGIDLLDKTLADSYATRPVGGLYEDYISYLGGYYYQQKPGSNMISADRKYISLTNQEQGVNYIYGVWAGMLRGAERIVITITDDATGEVIYEQIENDQRKSFGDGGSIYPSSIDIDFKIADYNLKNNSTYTVTLKGYLDYGDGGAETNDNNTFTFPFTVDFESPTLTGCEFYTEYDKSAKKNRLYAKIAVYDNHYAMSSMFGYINYDENYENSDGSKGGYVMSGFDRYMTPVYSDRNSTSYIVYELTDYVQDIKANSYNKNTFIVSLYDYALNESTYEIALPTEYLDLYYKETDITLSPNQTYDLKPEVYPSTEWGELVDYESTNPDVARVVNNKIVAVGSGKAVIYASVTLEDGTTKQQKLNITVLAEGDEGYSKYTRPVTDSFYLESYRTNKAYYFLGTDERDIGLTGSLTPFVGDYYALKMFPSESVTINYSLQAYFPDITEVKFTSSNDSIVTVDETTGEIIAVKEGYASVSVKVYMDGDSTYYSKSISIEVKDPYVTNGPWLMHYYGNGGIVSIPSSLGLTEIYQYAFSNYEYIPKDENDEISEEDPSKSKVWYIGDDTIEEVIIPEGVETIGPFAFANLTALRKVTLPSTLKKIDKGAFIGCEKLTTVIGLENVKFINQNAFNGTSLTGTLALNSAVAVADYAFANNTSITSVVMTEQIQSVGAFAFLDNTSLSSVNIAAEKIKLGQFAFSGCKKLTTMAINAAVIPNGTFNDCESLTMVDIGADVAVIGEHAFRNTAVSTFRVDEGNTTFKSVSDKPYLLSADGTQILLVAPATKTLTVNDSAIKSIANGAFSGNKNITTVSIPSVTSVGNYAFAECISLTSVTLGTLTYIGDYAFENAAISELPAFNGERIGKYAFKGSNVKSVEIAAGVTVGEGAFFDCKQLTSISVGNDAVLESYAFAFNTERMYGTIGYYRHNGKTVYYLKFASPVDSITIGDNVNIGDYAFWGAAEVTSITLGDNAYIGNYAFYNNSSLENIDLSTATYIGDYAFSGDVLYQFADQSLTEYAVDGLYYLFRYYASKLQNVDLSAAESIGECAFAYCHDLQSVVLGEKITDIPVAAFRDAKSLTTINLENVKTIGDYAFTLSAITSLDLSGATTVGKYAFTEAGALESITLGEGIEKIDEGAFAYAKKLNTVNGLEKAVYVGDYAFAYTALTSADLTSAEYLGSHAFLKDKETQAEFTVTLGTALKDIGDNPFAYCVLVPFSNVEKEEFNKVEYEKTVYTFDLGDYVKIIDGSIYRVVPNGLELITYCSDKVIANVAEGTVRVSALSFVNTNITSVQLPYTLKSIGHKAFFDCESLKVVTFTSYVAPALEEEYDLLYFVSYENLPTAPDPLDPTIGGLGLVDYKMWNATSNPTCVFYGASFVDYVGHVDNKIVMVKPVNGQKYNTFVLDQYFDVVIEGAAAADDTTLAAIAAINRIPEKLTLADKPIVEAARAAYSKIVVNEQRALVKNYQALEAAEKQIAKLEFLANDTPSTDPDDPIVDDPKEDFPVWAIVLIVVGGVLVLAAAGACVYFFVLRGKLNKKDENANDPATDEAPADDTASDADDTVSDAECENEKSDNVSEDNDN